MSRRRGIMIWMMMLLGIEACFRVLATEGCMVLILWQGCYDTGISFVECVYCMLSCLCYC